MSLYNRIVIFMARCEETNTLAAASLAGGGVQCVFYGDWGRGLFMVLMGVAWLVFTSACAQTEIFKEHLNDQQTR